LHTSQETFWEPAALHENKDINENSEYVFNEKSRQISATKVEHCRTGSFISYYHYKVAAKYAKA
jgi:hypothetical protein